MTSNSHSRRFLFFVFPLSLGREVLWNSKHKYSLKIWDPNWEELPLPSPQPREVGIPSWMQQRRQGPIYQEEASDRGQGAGHRGLTESCSVCFCAKRIGVGRVGRQAGPLETVNNGHTTRGPRYWEGIPKSVLWRLTKGSFLARTTLISLPLWHLCHPKFISLETESRAQSCIGKRNSRLLFFSLSFFCTRGHITASHFFTTASLFYLEYCKGTEKCIKHKSII